MRGDSSWLLSSAEAILGITIENAVPWCGELRLLRTRMLQPFFLMIYDVTHSPRPVPVSPLVVTNGSNSVDRTSGAIPDPVSAIVSRTRLP